MTDVTPYITVCGSASVDRMVGQTWYIAVSADELPVVTITLPDGVTVATPDVELLSSTGAYRAAYTLLVPGRHLADVSTTGQMVTLVCEALAVTASNALPDAGDLDTWLGGAGEHSWSDDDLTEALAVESANQRRNCRVPAAYPPDLRGALLRRGARYLFMKRQMTEQPRGDGTDYDVAPTIPPGRDVEIRRLEAPWRRMPIG